MREQVNDFYGYLNSKGVKGAEGQPLVAPDLKQLVQKNPALINYITGSWANHFGETPNAALKVMKDGSPKGAIANLYGGQALLDKFDLLKDAEKKTTEGQAQADVEIDKEKRLVPIKAATAKAEAQAKADVASSSSHNEDGSWNQASLPVGLVEGTVDPSQLSKRGSTYNSQLEDANRYSLSKYGRPFDIAKAQADYTYAKNPQTQNTLRMINGMTEPGGAIEIAAGAAKNLPQFNSATLNKVFNAAATEFGSTEASNFHVAMLGLGMNPDSATLAKHGFTSDTYNQAEAKYRQVTAGEIASGASFDPSTQKIYNAGDHRPIIRGAEKAFSDTLSGTSQLAAKAADKAGLRSTSSQGKGIFGEAPTGDETKPQGIGEHIGYIGEGLMEFITGDEALKGLSLAEKLGLATKIAKLAESHPAIAKLVGMGLRATRTGTVSGAQEASHGGDSGDILTAAGTGFLTHAGSEGLGELSKLAKPVIKKIAGESLETAPKWTGAGTAAKLAESNQEPAKRVIANVAHDTAEPIVQKFGQQAPETITSFKDAAEAVESAAKPVFKKLDEISNGGFQTAKNELDSANKIMRRATSMDDLKAAEKAAADAQSRIDTIFKSSFASIVGHCDVLQRSGLFSSKTSKLLPSFIQELQAECNQEFLETLHQLEQS